MKYLSIDIETTGRNPEIHKIIEFGCLLEDTEKSYDLSASQLPHYRCIISQEQKGEPEALEMNKEIFELMPDWGVSTAQFLKDFQKWCLVQKLPVDKKGRIRIVAAGKNFGSFDRQFLHRISGFTDLFDISSRYLDPAILFIKTGDIEVPSLQTCLDRAGIKKIVQHNSLADAADVVTLLRMHYLKLNLLGVGSQVYG